MRIWKKRITGFLIAMCAFCITAGVGTTQNVQAATKATYTIKKIQEKKTYKSSSATYSYELPQLKGNSTAVKRINQSLKSSYNNDLSLKKTLFKEFNDFLNLLFCSFLSSYVFESNSKVVSFLIKFSFTFSNAEYTAASTGTISATHASHYPEPEYKQKYKWSITE